MKKVVYHTGNRYKEGTLLLSMHAYVRMALRFNESRAFQGWFYWALASHPAIEIFGLQEPAIGAAGVALLHLH